MWLELDFEFGKGQHVDFTEVSIAGRASIRLSPDVIHCGWLGLKHQLTNSIRR